MSWYDKVAALEALEDALLERALVAELERAAPRVVGREIRFSTPTFKAYSSCDLEGCGKNSFLLREHELQVFEQAHGAIV